MPKFSKKNMLREFKKFILTEEYNAKYYCVVYGIFLLSYGVFEVIGMFYPEVTTLWFLIFGGFLIWVYFLLKVILLS